MGKIKFEIIRDWDGEIKGYKLGNNFLFKHYYYGNNYCWYISLKGDKQYCSQTEFSRAYTNGDIIAVSSCKRGKELLVKLNNNNK